LTTTTTNPLPPPVSADYYDLEFATAVNDLEPDEMSDEEKENVEQLREKIHEALGFDRNSIPKDILPLFSKARFLQFGRARQSKAKKWNFEKSVSMYIDMLKWYRTYDLPQKVAQWENVDSKGRAGEIFRKWMCVGAFGSDKRGVPVFHVKSGADIKGLVREIGYEAYERGSLHQIWYIGKDLEKASLKHGKHLVAGCVVFDYIDFSWTRAYNNIKPFGKHVKIQDANFPERLYTCLICRVPWIFNGIWTIFKPFLARDTVAKINILGRSANHLSALEEVIDRSQIPIHLGGELEGWPYGDGGEIPIGGGLGNSGGETKSTGGISSGRRSSMSQKILHVASKETIKCPLKMGETMMFQWRITEYDIDYTASIEERDGKEEEIIKAKARVSADGDGLQTLKYTAKNGDCTILLNFDNSFSFYREKDITYELQVVPYIIDGCIEGGDITVSSK
jgi:hypothetical protein